MKLYDLAGSNSNFRFSPYCWRIKLALEHKKLKYESIPWNFTEKDKLPSPNVGQVPVLVDENEVIYDSWTIAKYLEGKYPENPLFFSSKDLNLVKCIKYFFETTIQPIIGKIVVPEIYSLISEKDKTYFKDTREKRFNSSFKDLESNFEINKSKLLKAYEPLRLILADGNKFISGNSPSFVDYIAFAQILWVEISTKKKIFSDDDIIFKYQNVMLDLHNSFARKALEFKYAR